MLKYKSGENILLPSKKTQNLVQAQAYTLMYMHMSLIPTTYFLGDPTTCYYTR